MFKNSIQLNLIIPNSVSEVVVNPSWTTRGKESHNVFVFCPVIFSWAEDRYADGENDYEHDYHWVNEQRQFYSSGKHGEILSLLIFTIQVFAGIWTQSNQNQYEALFL